jgi:hypothetical protein
MVFLPHAYGSLAPTDKLLLKDHKFNQFTKLRLSVWENSTHMHSLRSLTVVLTAGGGLYGERTWRLEEEENKLESLEGIRSKQLVILDIRGPPFEL